MVSAALSRPAGATRITAIIRFCCPWNAAPDVAPRRFRVADSRAPAQFSDSIVKQPHANGDARTDVRHRPCCLVGAGCAVISLPSSHEGAERRKSLATRGTFAKAPACRLTGTRTSRRSTGGVSPLGTALPGAGRTSITSPRSGRHWRCPSVRPVQPLKAAPICGDGHGRWSETTRALLA